MQINTVKGTISPDSLGMALMHEHLLIASHTMRRIYPDWFDKKSFVPRAVSMLERAQAFGLKTLVDMTTFQLGRDIDIIREVADQTDMQIIVCTGYHWFEELCLIDKSADFLAKILIRDIEHGIENTNIKAGIIKCATDKYGITDLNRRYIQAAAIAHRETGLPVYTHSLHPYGAGQLEILLDGGVPPSRIVIGHAGDTDDFKYLSSIAKSGCYLGLDRFGVDTKHPDTQPFQKRLQTAIGLKELGYLRQLIFSQDASCFIDYWEGREGRGNPNTDFLQTDFDTLAFQYDYIMKEAAPRLLSANYTAEDLNTVFVETPKRLFD